jgi:hypothetical protein
MGWFDRFIIFLCPGCTLVFLSFEATSSSPQEDGASVASSVEELPEDETKLREMVAALPSKVEGERTEDYGDIS